MAFELSVPIDVKNPIQIDKRCGSAANGYAFWDNLAAAKAGINPLLRVKGLTVNVSVGGKVVEYWFESGILDANLVIKKSAGLSNHVIFKTAKDFTSNVLYQEVDSTIIENPKIGVSNLQIKIWSSTPGNTTLQLIGNNFARTLNETVITTSNITNVDSTYVSNFSLTLVSLYDIFELQILTDVDTFIKEYIIL